MINLKLSVLAGTFAEMSRDKVFACDNATPFYAQDYAVWAGINVFDIEPEHVLMAQGIQKRLPAGMWLVVSHK
jgi:hypothetical protein